MGPSDTNNHGHEEVRKAKAYKGICVALPHKGKPTKIFGNSPAEFISTLQGSSLGWVNFTTDDLEKDGTEVAVKLGFSDSLVSTLLKGYYASFEDRDTEMGIMVPAVKVSKLDVKAFPLIILVRKDLIVTIHSRNVERLVLFSRYADAFLRKLPEGMSLSDRLTMMLVRILDENNSHNFEHLREIEEQADSMGELLLDPESPRLEIGRKIYQLKHALITYLSTLWVSLDVLNTLRLGDAVYGPEYAGALPMGLSGDPAKPVLRLFAPYAVEASALIYESPNGEPAVHPLERGPGGVWEKRFDAPLTGKYYRIRTRQTAKSRRAWTLTPRASTATAARRWS